MNQLCYQSHLGCIQFGTGVAEELLACQRDSAPWNELVMLLVTFGFAYNSGHGQLKNCQLAKGTLLHGMNQLCYQPIESCRRCQYCYHIPTVRSCSNITWHFALFKHLSTQCLTSAGGCGIDTVHWLWLKRDQSLHCPSFRKSTQGLVEPGNTQHLQNIPTKQATDADKQDQGICLFFS